MTLSRSLVMKIHPPFTGSAECAALSSENTPTPFAPSAASAACSTQQSAVPLQSLSSSKAHWHMPSGQWTMLHLCYHTGRHGVTAFT